MEDTSVSRQKRKEEGRLLKKQRIEEAGGARPRSATAPAPARAPVKKSFPPKRSSKQQSHGNHGKHRFGRVMDSVPCRNRPRHSTLSIAIPGSVVANCQTRELKTHLVGQIARHATIYHVDEIIVFDDKLAKEHKPYFRGNRDRNRPRENEREDRRRPREEENTEAPKKEEEGETPKKEEDAETPKKEQEDRPPSRKSDPHTFMARVLQYCECPQYLRRHFFPMHPDLQFSGLLAPTDAPHHVRAQDRCKYREGVVLDKTGPSKGSLVNCGIPYKPVEINACLAPGIRCTVELDPASYGKAGQITGTVVSPSAPREDNGTYWGYTTRLASSIKAVMDDCPFEGGYDLKIGTSERGTESVESKGYSVPKFHHSLIVFGGVAGIEECVDADESIKLPGSESRKLFDQWVNVCPYQGSRTIRTEEAVLITLAKYSALLEAAGADSKRKQVEEEAAVAEFSDDGPSDESSDDE